MIWGPPEDGGGEPLPEIRREALGEGSWEWEEQTVTSLKPSCRTSSKFPRVRQASIVPAGGSPGQAAAAASSLRTQRLSAQLLGISPESRRPLTGNLDPSQTSAFHWACSHPASAGGSRRCCGSYRNSWARKGWRGAGWQPPARRA